MKYGAIMLTILSMTTFAASAGPQISAADTFLREAMAVNAGRNALLSTLSLTNDAAQYCCKVCAKGKACGDSCIARDRTCRVGQGCACDG